MGWDVYIKDFTQSNENILYKRKSREGDKERRDIKKIIAIYCTVKFNIYPHEYLFNKAYFHLIIFFM